MEDLSWERNMCYFPWSNNINHHHHQQEPEETFIFDTENIFLNPIQDLQKPDSTTCLNPITATTTTTSLESLDCLLSTTNSNADTSSDHDDGISVIFPNNNNSHNNINNILNRVTSGEYSTQDCIIESTKPNKNPGFYNHNPQRSKKPRLDPDPGPGRIPGQGQYTSSTINFCQGKTEPEETDSEAIAQMKEMIYRAAAFRPVSFADDEVVEKPRRKNVRISNDPQTVAARQRREKISERIRVLQKLVPGGNKMDTASMLDEAANYLKFLRSQVKALEQFGVKKVVVDYVGCGTSSDACSTSQVTVGVPFSMQSHFSLPRQ